MNPDSTRFHRRVAVAVARVLAAAAVLSAAFASSGPAAATSGTDVTVVDPQAQNGSDSSLALRDDDLPVISYRDISSGSLKVVACNDVKCSGADESPHVVDTEGRDTALALRSSGHPVVSYVGADSSPRIALCEDEACAAPVTPVVLDSEAFARDTDLELDAMGRPTVAWSTVGGVWLSRCQQPPCTQADQYSVSQIYPAGGRSTSLRLRSQGFAVVAFHDTAAQQAVVIYCENALCSDRTVNVVANDAGLDMALALDAEDVPVMSYTDFDRNVHLLRCLDKRCNTTAAPVKLDTTANLLAGTSLVMDAAGRPVVSLHSEAETLTVHYCRDSTCALRKTTTAAPSVSGWSSSLALDSDGHPVMSSGRQSNWGQLLYAHCESCRPPAARPWWAPVLPIRYAV